MTNMNNELLEKLIKFNSERCPRFNFKNPLVEREVAGALSKSFVKILNLSDQNTNVNNNSRLTVLENIRKLCVNEPENHHKLDDNFTELLTNFYEMHLNEVKENDSQIVEKQLDAFLVRKLKEVDISSTYPSFVNPEIVQALINLSDSGALKAAISDDIIHWNTKNLSHQSLLKTLWKDNCNNQAIDDISIKMRTEIEKLLLKTCNKILTNEVSVEFLTSDCNLLGLMKTCSKSPQCFQICCGILNFLFIMTNYDEKLIPFISHFVQNVKNNCDSMRFSSLYPGHLSSTVVLLDMDLDKMPAEAKHAYSEFAWKFISKVQDKSENEFQLLLSHFPQWFEIYSAKKTEKMTD